MSIEVKDKRNIDLIQLRELANGDHFLHNKSIYVMSDHESKSNYCGCVNIKDGTYCDIKKSDEVQQVHLVIEIHLV